MRISDWSSDVCSSDLNARFAVAPEQPASAFVADRAGAWREILCIQDERRVGNDNTVKWHGLHLQLPPRPLRPHFVTARVRVHEYPAGTHAVFLGPPPLAAYDADVTQDRKSGREGK